MASKDTPKSEWIKHVWKSQQKGINNTISDSANTKIYYSCHDRITWPAESAEAGTWDGCNHIGRDKERRLLVKRVVWRGRGREGGSSQMGCSHVQRWSIRSAHLVGNLLFVLCAAQRREYLSCYIDLDPMGYSWRTLAVPSFHHFRSFPLTPSTLHTHKLREWETWC